MRLYERCAYLPEVCGLVIFGLQVWDIMDWPAERNLDVCELWSGVGAVAGAARIRALSAQEFDKARTPMEDITSLSGFRQALQYVLSLREGGLLMMAPVCSSFVWLNSSRCMRTAENHFAGRVSYEPVHTGNVMGEMAAFLFAVAWARGAHVVLENPPASHLWDYLPVKRVLEAINSHTPLHHIVTYRCAFDDAPHGERYLKPYKFLGSGSWLERARRSCDCPDRRHRELAVSHDGAVSGIRDRLAESAAYPPRLGAAIVNAWVSTVDGTVGEAPPLRAPPTPTKASRRAASWLIASDSAPRLCKKGRPAAGNHSGPSVSQSWCESDSDGEVGAAVPGASSSWQQPLD